MPVSEGLPKEAILALIPEDEQPRIGPVVLPDDHVVPAVTVEIGRE